MRSFTIVVAFAGLTLCSAVGVGCNCGRPVVPDSGTDSGSDAAQESGTDATLPPDAGAAACADGLDNDGDGLVDSADPACGDPSDDLESPWDQRHAAAATMLFVIDNSGSMCEEQANVRANFASLIGNVTALAPGVPYHVGVVTTDTVDPTDAGRLQNVPVAVAPSALCTSPPPPADCSGLPSPLPKFITEADLPADDYFQCLASVGITGYGGETALGAARLALDPTLLVDPSANLGFAIPGSLLVVVMLGDEDDCSVCSTACPSGGACSCGPLPSLLSNLECAIDRVGELTPVADFTTYLSSTAVFSDYVVASIIGLDAAGSSAGPIVADPSGSDRLVPICSAAVAGTAAPAPRIEAITLASPGGATYQICQDDFASDLAALGALIATRVASDYACLAAAPCAGATAADVRASIATVAATTTLAPGTDYTLVFDAACAGGFAVLLTTAIVSGETLWLEYDVPPDC